VAGPDQALQIPVCGMDGHAAHRDIFARMMTALGQCDVQGGRRGYRILEEHLIKIAHPVEQQTIRIGLLDFQILGHHWRDGGFGGGLAHGPAK
jgi:hypothetical protein